MSARRITGLLRQATRGERGAQRWLGRAWLLADTLGLDRDPGRTPRPVRRPDAPVPRPSDDDRGSAE